MMLNIYQLHSNPKQLRGYQQASEKVPEIVWGRYREDPEELKKRKDILAQDPKTAYLYAWLVQEGRFPEGEDAIATHVKYALLYASRIINGRFPKGEKVIAQDPYYATRYAVEILQDRFPEGEKAIKQDPDYWADYVAHVYDQ